MTDHGAATREPVYSGTRRIPGLYKRQLADGAGVYEVAARLGGKVRRHRLAATTKTDAIAELRALQVDYARGETFRSPATAPTVTDLAADWMRHLTARVGASTVGAYGGRLTSRLDVARARRPPRLRLEHVRPERLTGAHSGAHRAQTRMVEPF